MNWNLCSSAFKHYLEAERELLVELNLKAWSQIILSLFILTSRNDAYMSKLYRLFSCNARRQCAKIPQIIVKFLTWTVSADKKCAILSKQPSVDSFNTNSLTFSSFQLMAFNSAEQPHFHSSAFVNVQDIKWIVSCSHFKITWFAVSMNPHLIRSLHRWLGAAGMHQAADSVCVCYLSTSRWLASPSSHRGIESNTDL